MMKPTTDLLKQGGQFLKREDVAEMLSGKESGFWLQKKWGKENEDIIRRGCLNKEPVWIPISRDPPYGVELGLWLKAEEGSDEPFGEIIGMFMKTDMGEQWVQKFVGGEVINAGLRANLITHYRFLDDPPENNGQEETDE